jgi:hypothetical protein
LSQPMPRWLMAEIFRALYRRSGRIPEVLSKD